MPLPDSSGRTDRVLSRWLPFNRFDGWPRVPLRCRRESIRRRKNTPSSLDLPGTPCFLRRQDDDHPHRAGKCWRVFAQFPCHFEQRQMFTRASRAFHLEVITINRTIPFWLSHASRADSITLISFRNEPAPLNGFLVVITMFFGTLWQFDFLPGYLFVRDHAQ